MDINTDEIKDLLKAEIEKFDLDIDVSEVG